MKQLIRFLIIAVALINVNAQTDEKVVDVFKPSQNKSIFSISGGLLTMKIIGDNPNSAPMIQRDTTKKNIIGGGFTQTNSGFTLKLKLDLDQSGNYNIPIGIEYLYLLTSERIPISKNVTAMLKNESFLPALSVGLDYKFYKFKFTDVKAYLGLDLKTTFVQQGKFHREYRYEALDSNDITDKNTKSSCTRLGGNIKLGFVGNLIGNVSINSFISFGAVNLLLTDDSRGELLTPTLLTDSKESIVTTMNFGLLLEYRF